MYGQHCERYCVSGAEKAYGFMIKSLRISMLDASGLARNAGLVPSRRASGCGRGNATCIRVRRWQVPVQRTDGLGGRECRVSGPWKPPRRGAVTGEVRRACPSAASLAGGLARPRSKAPPVGSMMTRVQAKMPMVVRRATKDVVHPMTLWIVTRERGILAEPSGTWLFRAVCGVRAPCQGRWTCLRRPSLHPIPEKPRRGHQRPDRRRPSTRRAATQGRGRDAPPVTPGGVRRRELPKHLQKQPADRRPSARPSSAAR